MLLEFSAENFASIGQKQTISLLTGKARGKSEHLLKAYKNNVLKFSSIYGANAAGKSNMIKAMHFAKKVINYGNVNRRFISTNKANPTWDKKPTEFIYTLFVNNKIYEYGFKIMSFEEKIIREWLIEKNSNTEKALFIRDFSKGLFVFNIASKITDVQKRLDVYTEDAKKEEELLFLKEINTKKGDLFTVDSSLQYLRDIYNWFTNKLKFVYPNNSDLGRYSFLTYPDNKYKLLECLQDLDIPITELTYIATTMEQAFKELPVKMINEMNEECKEIYANSKESEITIRIDDHYCIIEIDDNGIKNVKTTIFTHSDYGMFDFKEESDGTKRILELAEILTSPEEDTTYIVDELDRSLHPLLTEKFVSMYLNPDKPNKKQLVITTHQTSLLNLKNLRKDEIYFVTNTCGQSEYIRLDEYDSVKTRADLNIELGYLHGRYNGIPKIARDVQI